MSQNVKKGIPKKVAVVPSDRELQIDLDTDRAFSNFKRNLAFFRSQARAYSAFSDWSIRVRITRSPGGNRHATVALSQRMTLLERLCAQMLLGDDPNRAMYNFFRYLNGSRFPILFYEKVTKNGRKAR